MLADVVSQSRAGAVKSRSPSLIARLSPRENQVLVARSVGQSYKAIAADLGLSIHTVKHHAGHAFRKLGVNCSLAAVRLL